MKMSKRILSLLMCVCMFCVTSFSGLCVSAETRTEPITRRVLVLSAPLDGGAISQATVNCMVNAFVCAGFTNVDSYIQPTVTTSLNTFLNNIGYYLGDADDNDVSYVVIQAHGDEFGQLQIGNYLLTMSTLKQRLDAISGHIVLMVNACYSGTFIENERGINDSNRLTVDELLLDNFLNEDDSASRGVFSCNKYTVYCASESWEKAWSVTNGYAWAARAWSIAMGFIPYYTGNGYQDPDGPLADDNDDAIVTAKEFFDCSYEQLDDFSMNSDGRQHMCYYSASPYFTFMTENYQLGDVNRNGLLQSSDVTLINQHIAGSIVLSGRQAELADINGDGVISTIDALRLTQLITVLS